MHGTVYWYFEAYFYQQIYLWPRKYFNFIFFLVYVFYNLPSENKEGNSLIYKQKHYKKLSGELRQGKKLVKTLKCYYNTHPQLFCSLCNLFIKLLPLQTLLQGTKYCKIKSYSGKACKLSRMPIIPRKLKILTIEHITRSNENNIQHHC